jgi:hypothetical protein
MAGCLTRRHPVPTNQLTDALGRAGGKAHREPRRRLQEGKTMIKKLSLLLAAAAMLALAVPAIASAHKVTSKAGVLAPVGTVLTLTGSDVTFLSNTLGTTTCKSVTLTVKLTTNDGTNVTGSGTTKAPATKECAIQGAPVTVTEVNITLLKAEGTETWMNFVWTEDIDLKEAVECTYTGTKVPFTYTTGSDSIVFTKAGPIVGSPALCGNSTLTATFTLEIEKTPVILD